MLAALLVVFREAIEAGLIVGIVLAATNGVSRRALWITYGIAGGVFGACVIAAFAGKIAALFQGNGQEFFDAGVLLLAVLMLTWHNVWMAGHGRAITSEMKGIGAAVSAGERPLAALAVVVGIAVLREGSEVVLFLYGIASQGGTTAGSLLLGGSLGLAAGAAVSAMMYFGLLAVPVHRLFVVTSGLITLLAAGMAAQAIAFVQQAGYFQILTGTLWNTSRLLPQDGPGPAGIVGRMLHTLVGYNDSPTGAQLLAYVATILAIVCLMRFERGRRSARASMGLPAHGDSVPAE